MTKINPLQPPEIIGLEQTTNQVMFDSKTLHRNIEDLTCKDEKPTFYLSSKSPTVRFYWPHDLIKQIKPSLSTYFQDNFHIHNKQSIFILATPRGSWVEGIGLGYAPPCQPRKVSSFIFPNHR